MNKNQGLTDRMVDLVRKYESITNPKEKYKAESEICRIADRLGFRGQLILYGKDSQQYIPNIERYTGESKFCGIRSSTEYRIPRLEKVISKEQVWEIAKEHPELSPIDFSLFLGKQKYAVLD